VHGTRWIHAVSPLAVSPMYLSARFPRCSSHRRAGFSALVARVRLCNGPVLRQGLISDALPRLSQKLGKIPVLTPVQKPGRASSAASRMTELERYPPQGAKVPDMPGPLQVEWPKVGRGAFPADADSPYPVKVVA